MMKIRMRRGAAILVLLLSCLLVIVTVGVKALSKPQCLTNNESVDCGSVSTLLNELDASTQATVSFIFMDNETYSQDNHFEGVCWVSETKKGQFYIIFCNEDVFERLATDWVRNKLLIHEVLHVVLFLEELPVNLHHQTICGAIYCENYPERCPNRDFYNPTQDVCGAGGLDADLAQSYYLLEDNK